MKKLLFAVLDNGMGLSRTRWAVCFATALMSVRNAEVALFHSSYPYPNGAMNRVTAAFMESNYEELVTIDTDLIFTPDHLNWLLSHEVPFVAGYYPKKERTLTFPMDTLTEDNPFADTQKLQEQPLVEVAWVARGFTKIHREVFNVLGGACQGTQWWSDLNTGRQHPEWWQLEPGGHSEDKNFCDRYRSLGGRILVDSRCQLQHEGTAVYPLR